MCRWDTVGICGKGCPTTYHLCADGGGGGGGGVKCGGEPAMKDMMSKRKKDYKLTSAAHLFNYGKGFHTNETETGHQHMVFLCTFTED